MAASGLIVAGYEPPSAVRMDPSHKGNFQVAIRRFNSFEQMGADIGVDGAEAMREILASVDKELHGDYFFTCRPEFVYVAGLWQPNSSNGEQPLITRPDPIGIAVVEKPFEETHYLDKIAVRKDKQRRGVGRRLFYEVEGDCENLIWRARPKNPFCGFYLERSTGHREHDPWIVFWSGFQGGEDGESLERAVDYAANKPRTLFDYKPSASSLGGALPSPNLLYQA